MKEIIKKIWKFTKKVLPFVLLIIVMWFFFIRDKKNNVMVKKVQIESREVSKTVSASGSIESENNASLSFSSTGKVQRIVVNKGDFVKKGQLIAYLDASSQSYSAQATKDARDIILRNIDLLKVDPEAQKDTLGGDTEYEITLRKYNEQLSQAEASYQAQKSLLSNYYIYAPYEGTIVDVLKKEGEVSSMGETVVKIADLNNLVFKTNIDQEDYGFIKENMPVEIELDTYPNFKYEGYVKSLPLYADSSDNFEIEISVKSNEDKPIRLGMLGDAHIILAKVDGLVSTLMLGEFYYDEQDNPYIWVADDKNILSKQYIEVGLEGDIFTEVKSSINGNIVIPLDDKQILKEGYTAVFTQK